MHHLTITATSKLPPGSRVDRNRPFPSYLLPLYQNESWCETIHIKMSSTYRFIFVQIKLIVIGKVLHEDSFWNRGTMYLGNGLFVINWYLFPCSDIYLTMRVTTSLTVPVHLWLSGEGGSDNGPWVQISLDLRPLKRKWTRYFTRIVPVAIGYCSTVWATWQNLAGSLPDVLNTWSASDSWDLVKLYCEKTCLLIDPHNLVMAVKRTALLTETQDYISPVQIISAFDGLAHQGWIAKHL